VFKTSLGDLRMAHLLKDGSGFTITYWDDYSNAEFDAFEKLHSEIPFLNMQLLQSCNNKRERDV
jgi:hypothetical protein